MSCVFLTQKYACFGGAYTLKCGWNFNHIDIYVTTYEFLSSHSGLKLENSEINNVRKMVAQLPQKA